MENNSLAHYGVKGMKWGVRHEIATRSRMGAQLGDDLKWASRRTKRIDKMISKREAKGKSTQLLKTERAKMDAFVKSTKKLQSQLYSGLSKSDIKQGERYIKGMKFLTLGLSTGLGAERYSRYGNNLVPEDRHAYNYYVTRRQANGRTLNPYSEKSSYKVRKK